MKKLIVLFLSLFIIPNLAFGAIAFDALTDGGTGAAPTLTFSHTTSGTNRILFVDVLGDVSASQLITGVTYAGVSMTKVGERHKTAGNGYWISTWVLANPTSGANNVVVSASSGNLFGNIATSYTGVAQTSVVDASTTAENTSATSLTTTLTTVADNTWLHGVMFNNLAETKTAGTNTLIKSNFVSTQGVIIDSNSAQTPAGSKSMTVSGNGGAADWVGVMASFAPFTGSATNVCRIKAVGLCH